MLRHNDGGHAGRMLQHALEYVGLGWQLVPCWGVRDDGRCGCGQPHPGTAQRTIGKHPILRSWQTQPVTDEERVQEIVDRWPGLNIGVLLGKGSGVIDVEWDDEAGKELAIRLGLTKIITPTYRSGRSEHRLFRWHDKLPTVAVVKIGGLEIRTGGDGRGSQSILPPSRHWAGGDYEWLPGLSPGETDLADLPEGIIEAARSGAQATAAGGGGDIFSHGERTGPSSRTLIEEAAITEGSRNDILFRGALGIARQWTGLERADVQAAFAEMIRSANVAKMKPPLEDDEVAKVVASAIRYALQTPTAVSGPKDAGAIESRQAGSGTPRTWIEHGLSCSGGVYGPGDWRMTIIESDPPVYRLHVPAWVDLTDDRTGNVTIDAEWLQKPAAVATAILKATKSVSFSGPEWKMLWMGSRKQPSLHNALLAEAHREPAPPEMQEWAPAAEHLLRQIDAAIEGAEPDDAGNPVWVDGVCWFEWPTVFDQAVQMGRLTKAVVERLYRRLDMIHRPRRLWPEAETGRRRQYGLSRQAVAELRRMARGGV